MTAGVAVRFTASPAPLVVTRVALSAWSRPWWRMTMGTSAASVRTTVPWPPWVTTALVCRSTSECGAAATTVTLAGARSASGSSAGPVVTIPRTGSVPSASTIRCRQPAWSWNVEDSATSTSGPSPAGGVHEIPAAQAGSSSTAPT